MRSLSAPSPRLNTSAIPGGISLTPQAVPYAAAENRPLPLNGQPTNILYVGTDDRTARLLMSSCAARSYPARSAATTLDAIRLFEHHPADLVICEFGMARQALPSLRQLTGGRAAQVLLTASGNLNHPSIRDMASAVEADGLLPCPLPIMDLIDTIERSGQTRQRCAPEELLKRAAELADLWARGRTGTLEVTGHHGLGLSLRGGELVRLQGENLQAVLSAGDYRFLMGPVHGTARRGALGRALVEISGQGPAVDVLEQHANRLVERDAIALALPLQQPTVMLLRAADGQTTLGALAAACNDSLDVVREDLSILSHLGLLPLQPLHNWSKLRSQLNRRITLLKQGDADGALGLQPDATDDDRLVAAERYARKLSRWVQLPELPNKLRVDIVHLLEHARSVSERVDEPAAAASASADASTSPLPDKRIAQARAAAARWDWHQTASLAEAVLSTTPMHPEGLTLMGWARFNTGALEAARLLIEQAISVAPDDPSAHYYAAWICRTQRDIGPARVAARRALRLSPDEPLYRELAEELEAN